MARDRRPYAQIDVGWYMNPKWFQVERFLRDAMPDAMQDALLHALQDAKQLHLTSILYSAQARSDGMFPVDAVKSFARAAYEESVTALFESGMWINHPGGMAEIRHFLKHQPSADELETASERGRKAAKTRWKNANGNAERNASRNARGNAEKRREEKSNKAEKIADAFSRDDVSEVFNYFNDSLKRLDAKQVSKTLTSADAIRRLIDTDGRTVEQIKTAIDFAHSHDFWQSNILSPKTLRDKYDTLRLQAKREQNTPQQRAADYANDRWALAQKNKRAYQNRKEEP